MPDSTTIGADFIPPPYDVQQRASDAALMLRQEFPGRITLQQNVEMEVITRYAPEQLGWKEIGKALTLWAMVVEVRK